MELPQDNPSGIHKMEDVSRTSSDTDMTDVPDQNLSVIALWSIVFGGVGESSHFGAVLKLGTQEVLAYKNGVDWVQLLTEATVLYNQVPAYGSNNRIDLELTLSQFTITASIGKKVSQSGEVDERATISIGSDVKGTRKFTLFAYAKTKRQVFCDVASPLYFRSGPNIGGSTTLDCQFTPLERIKPTTPGTKPSKTPQSIKLGNDSNQGINQGIKITAIAHVLAGFLLDLFSDSTALALGVYQIFESEDAEASRKDYGAENDNGSIPKTRGSPQAKPKAMPKDYGLDTDDLLSGCLDWVSPGNFKELREAARDDGIIIGTIVVSSPNSLNPLSKPGPGATNFFFVGPSHRWIADFDQDVASSGRLEISLKISQFIPEEVASEPIALEEFPEIKQQQELVDKESYQWLPAMTPDFDRYIKEVSQGSAGSESDQVTLEFVRIPAQQLEIQAPTFGNTECMTSWFVSDNSPFYSIDPSQQEQFSEGILPSKAIESSKKKEFRAADAAALWRHTAQELEFVVLAPEIDSFPSLVRGTHSPPVLFFSRTDLVNLSEITQPSGVNIFVALPRKKTKTAKKNMYWCFSVGRLDPGKFVSIEFPTELVITNEPTSRDAEQSWKYFGAVIPEEGEFHAGAVPIFALSEAELSAVVKLLELFFRGYLQGFTVLPNRIYHEYFGEYKPEVPTANESGKYLRAGETAFVELTYTLRTPKLSQGAPEVYKRIISERPTFYDPAFEVHDKILEAVENLSDGWQRVNIASLNISGHAFPPLTAPLQLTNLKDMKTLFSSVLGLVYGSGLTESTQYAPYSIYQPEDVARMCCVDLEYEWNTKEFETIVRIRFFVRLFGKRSVDICELQLFIASEAEIRPDSGGKDVLLKISDAYDNTGEGIVTFFYDWRHFLVGYDLAYVSLPVLVESPEHYGALTQAICTVQALLRYLPPSKDTSGKLLLETCELSGKKIWQVKIRQTRQTLDTVIPNTSNSSLVHFNFMDSLQVHPRKRTVNELRKGIDLAKYLFYSHLQCVSSVERASILDAWKDVRNSKGIHVVDRNVLAPGFAVFSVGSIKVDSQDFADRLIFVWNHSDDYNPVYLAKNWSVAVFALFPPTGDDGVVNDYNWKMPQLTLENIPRYCHHVATIIDDWVYINPPTVFYTHVSGDYNGSKRVKLVADRARAASPELVTYKSPGNYAFPSEFISRVVRALFGIPLTAKQQGKQQLGVVDVKYQIRETAKGSATKRVHLLEPPGSYVSLRPLYQEPTKKSSPKGKGKKKSASDQAPVSGLRSINPLQLFSPNDVKSNGGLFSGDLFREYVGTTDQVKSIVRENPDFSASKAWEGKGNKDTTKNERRPFLPELEGLRGVTRKTLDSQTAFRIESTQNTIRVTDATRRAKSTAEGENAAPVETQTDESLVAHVYPPPPKSKEPTVKGQNKPQRITKTKVEFVVPEKLKSRNSRGPFSRGMVLRIVVKEFLEFYNRYLNTRRERQRELAGQSGKPSLKELDNNYALVILQSSNGNSTRWLIADTNSKDSTATQLDQFAFEFETDAPKGESAKQAERELKQDRRKGFQQLISNIVRAKLIWLVRIPEEKRGIRFDSNDTRILRKLCNIVLRQDLERTRTSSEVRDLFQRLSDSLVKDVIFSSKSTSKSWLVRWRAKEWDKSFYSSLIADITPYLMYSLFNGVTEEQYDALQSLINSGYVKLSGSQYVLTETGKNPKPKDATLDSHGLVLEQLYTITVESLKVRFPLPPSSEISKVLAASKPKLIPGVSTDSSEKGSPVSPRKPLAPYSEQIKKKRSEDSESSDEDSENYLSDSDEEIFFDHITTKIPTGKRSRGTEEGEEGPGKSARTSETSQPGTSVLGADFVSHEILCGHCSKVARYYCTRCGPIHSRRCHHN